VDTPSLALIVAVAATAATAAGCAGETAEVRARFVATRAECPGEVKVVLRMDPSAVPEDAPDREKLRGLLAASKAGHAYYDVHGCGGGAVFDCFDQNVYNDAGGSKKERHCGTLANWGKVSAATVAAQSAVVYEATDGSTRNAPDDHTVAMSNEACVASAAHDLPCDDAKVVGNDSEGHANAAEGCGLRVSYDLVRFVPEGSLKESGAGSGFRYKLKSRESLATGPAPPPKGGKH